MPLEKGFHTKFKKCIAIIRNKKSEMLDRKNINIFKVNIL